MRLSFKWLNEYLQLQDLPEIEGYSNKLNETLTEVDGVEDVTPKFENIYVGKILDLEKHPNADRLRITKITIGNDKIYTIVCGAQNIYKDMVVPVSIEGSILYDEDGNKFEIKKTKLRGIESEGMLCSPRELGISKDHSGILDLTHDKTLKVGDKLDPIFTDKILKIENKAITHRPDCFSHYGVAKELEAIIQKRYISYINAPQKELEFDKQKTGKKDEYILSNDIFKLKNTLTLDIDGYTRRYSTITIKGVKIKSSPAFVQARLLALGHRPINNIVDLTNYVMYDIGQPLHAFDMDYTNENFLIRTGKKGEKLTTLDNIEHELTENDITITDGKRALDIGGIIGGLDSGIKDETQNIVLVADNFDPGMLRKTSWYHGIRTDAVTIYEKNIDPNLTIKGIVEFVNLYKRFYPEDEIEVSAILDYYPDPRPEEKELDISLDDIYNLIGITIPFEEIKKDLTYIGLSVKDKGNGQLAIMVPSLRTDLNIKEDIIEEIIRLYGYSNILVTPYFYKLKTVTTYPGRDEEVKAKYYFLDNGFYELETYIFADSKELKALGIKKNPVKVKNPLNSEIDVLKTSALPELINAVKNNARYYTDFRLFEISSVFSEEKGKTNEQKVLSGALYSKVNKSRRLEKHEDDLFYTAKAILLGMMQRINVDMSLVSIQLPHKTKEGINETIFDPNASLNVYVKGEYIGSIGLTQEQAARQYDLENNFILFEFTWSPILSIIERNYKLKEYSKFPSIDYDISFFINKDVYVSDIMSYVQNLGLKNIVDITTIDEYLKDDKKSIAIRLTFNDKNKTLTSEDVSQEVEKAKDGLVGAFKAILR